MRKLPAFLAAFIFLSACSNGSDADSNINKDTLDSLNRENIQMVPGDTQRSKDTFSYDRMTIKDSIPG